MTVYEPGWECRILLCLDKKFGSLGGKRRDDSDLLGNGGVGGGLDEGKVKEDSRK